MSKRAWKASCSRVQGDKLLEDKAAVNTGGTSDKVAFLEVNCCLVLVKRVFNIFLFTL